jgi:pectate lyase
MFAMTLEHSTSDSGGARGLRWIATLFGLFAVLGCSTQRSELINGKAQEEPGDSAMGYLGDASTVKAIEDIADDRPIGGASLGSGTTGGGSFADAQANGHVVLVQTPADFLDAVSGDAPTIILLNEGTYDFTLNPGRTAQACSVACNPDTPVATETVASSSCPADATLFDVYSTYETARVGDNKTILGLGAGATLKNLRMDLSGSSNVILRNLGFLDINPGIYHDGEAILMWPADHVWIDHCSFQNISYTSMHIVSSWDETNNQALTAVAGFITISWNHFDGRTNKACGGQDPTVLSANRNPALTFHHNWFDTCDNWNPYLLGPGTWGHLFNNAWTDITNTSVAVTCAAIALLEGNAFESARDAVYISDSGAPTWSFCQTGLFGQTYAPTAANSYEQNLFDSASSLSLNGQATDGNGLSLPVQLAGTTYLVNVPAPPLGGSATSYQYDLEASPADVSAIVKSGAGIGHLF